MVAEWLPFGERAAYSVNRVLSLYCLFVIMVLSHFGFEDRYLALIVPVSVHCLLLLLSRAVRIILKKYFLYCELSRLTHDVGRQIAIY